MNSGVDWYVRDLEVPSVFPPVYTLPGGASLTARFEDADGRPVGARLEVWVGPFGLREYLEEKPVIRVRMDTGGPHAFELTPGRHSAVVSPHPGGATPTYARVVGDLLVEDETDLPVTLPHAGGTCRLAGRVADGQGGPSGNVPLYAYEPAQGLLVTVTVKEGRYEVLLPVGEYQIALRVASSAGGQAIHEFGPIVVDGDQTWDIDLDHVTSISDPSGIIPDRFSLEQNYPNPFNAGTVIEYAVDTEGPAELVLYDLTGQRVRTLVLEWLAPGPQVTRWEGRDDAGRAVASGVYLYRLVASRRVATRKLLLLK